MSSVSYGFIETAAPAQQRTVVIDFTYCVDDPALLGEIFSLADRVKTANKAALVSKIEATEAAWEQARVAARNARDAFNSHKRGELAHQNDVQAAQAKMTAAYRLSAAWRDSPMDPYASKTERDSHAATLADYQRKAQQAESEAVTANAMQNAYYAQAQQFADDYNSKQVAFVNLDGDLKRLKLALENLD